MGGDCIFAGCLNKAVPAKDEPSTSSRHAPSYTINLKGECSAFDLMSFGIKNGVMSCRGARVCVCSSPRCAIFVNKITYSTHKQTNKTMTVAARLAHVVSLVVTAPTSLVVSRLCGPGLDQGRALMSNFKAMRHVLERSESLLESSASTTCMHAISGLQAQSTLGGRPLIAWECPANSLLQPVL